MNELNIDKTHWKKYRFDEVCRQVNEATKDPAAEGLDHVIGLEHIEPNNLHITHWDTLEKETTFTRKFKKGQVLFGRRRAYQRKVAYAEFDGICSGDILVFEAIEKVMLPELLPFLIQSEGFFQKALATSAGSLSPRTKFKELADYEFLLPPKAEQKRLAELLWAADEVVEKEKREMERMEELYNNRIESMFTGEKVAFGECANINESTLSAKTPSDYRFLYIDIASIVSPKHLGPLTEYSFAEAPSRARRIVKNNDIVLSLVRPYLKAFVQIKNRHEELIASTGTAVVSAKPDNNTDFLFHMLFSKAFMTFCENRMNGTNYPAITPADLSDFQIPSYSFDEQKSKANELNSIDNTIEQLETQIAISQQIKQELINKIL